MGGGGGGKKGGASFEATDYRLSIHYAVCVGPVDEVLDIIVSDKSLATYVPEDTSGVGTPFSFFPFLGANVEPEEQYATFTPFNENGQFDVDAMDLFGGPKKGGGLKGRINFLLGSATQVLPEFLAGKLSRTSATVTGYRNICSVWFTGEDTEGFTWSTNIPAVPAPKIKVKRAPVGLTGDDPMIGADANPAHIIYECLTNTDWGAGYAPENVPVASFLAAAQTLRDEAFGLSLIWTGQTSIEAFVNEVLQHISANLTFDLATAEWTLTLLRGDYDTDTILEINPRNADLRSFQRRSWGETINEVIVTWTNPDNEEEETVTQQDATGFAVQRGAVSDASRNYPGIRSQDIAWKVAERDLRQAGTPLAAIEVDMDLSMRGLKPGQVLWFNWDEEDEDGDVFLEPIVVRVLKVKEPKRGSASFEVSLIEDVFSYGVVRTAVQTSEFYSPNQEPIDVPYVDLLDSPYFVVAQQFGDTDAQAFEYPRGHISVFSNTGLTDVREIDLYSERPVPEQDPSYQSISILEDIGRFTLSDSLTVESETVLSLPSGYSGKNIVVGGFLVLGEGASQEVCVVTAFASGDLTIRRGCLDTVPRAWAAGTVAWEVTRSALVVDGTEVLAGEDLDYKLLPVTSIRRLNLSEATAHTITVGDRMHLPLRPANVEVDGVPGFDFTINSTATDAVVTWADRNRITETSQVLAWDDVGVSPEVGQTTSVQLHRVTQNLADNGQEPTGMPSTAGAVITASAEPSYPGFGGPADVASAGNVNARGRLNSAHIDNTGGRRFYVEVFVKDGDSGTARIAVENSNGNVLVYYDLTAGTTSDNSPANHTLNEVSMEDMGSGIWRLVCDVSMSNVDPTLLFTISPYTKTVDEYITVLGSRILYDVPAPYELIASNTGVVSGETTTLDLSGASLSVWDELELSVWSVRDGFDSWQKGVFPVSVI